MSRYAYAWNSEMKFSGFKQVNDDYQLQSNETFKRPKDGLYDGTWNGDDWVGITREEWEAKQPKEPVEPSAEQQMIATLGQQQAKTDANVKQMQQMIAMLGNQMASADAKEKSNGGN